jgi:biopolymer transport protein ExbD
MTSELSLASISDIAFLLIIFFMVASVFVIKDGIHLALPHKSGKPVIKTADEITIITVTDTKRILLNGRSVSASELERELTVMAADEERYLLMRIGSGVPYFKAVEVIDAIKHAGMRKLSIKMI